MDFQMIDEKRLQRHMTVPELCEVIGVEQSTYYKWRDNPSRMKVEMLIRIAKALKMNNKEKLKLLG